MKILETKEEFDKFLQDAGDKLVVIDFYADWCGPCKHISPKFVAMAAEFPDICCAKVNVDANGETAEDAKVSAMPTFKFYKNKVEVGEVVGANEAKLREMINSKK